MEQVRDKHKIEHQRYTIQYNDKAIEGLRYRTKIGFETIKICLLWCFRFCITQMFLDCFETSYFCLKL